MCSSSRHGSDLRSTHGLEEELTMNMRLYRLMELHQRIDEALRRERHRRRPDPFALALLTVRKLRIKDRMRGAFGALVPA